jgi:hypothetical protein
MYVIIGSHFVSLEGKFLPIALIIVRITLNVTTFLQQVVIKLSVFESLTSSF